MGRDVGWPLRRRHTSRPRVRISGLSPPCVTLSTAGLGERRGRAGRWLGALTARLRGGTGPPGRPGWRWRHDAVHDGPGAVGVPALEAGEGEDRPGAAAETPQAHRPVAAGVGCREDGRDVSVLSGSSTLTPDAFVAFWRPAPCVGFEVTITKSPARQTSFSCLRVNWVRLIHAGPRRPRVRLGLASPCGRNSVLLRVGSCWGSG